MNPGRLPPAGNGPRRRRSAKTRQGGDPVYLVCTTCGHVFNTPAELLEQHNLLIARVNASLTNPAATFPLASDADVIDACPSCHANLLRPL